MQKNTQVFGFTLMEVLVALVVISIGLFGIAGMQLQSLKTNHDAYLRTQATFLAYSLIDKMRANRIAALAGAYNTTIGAGPGGSNNCYTNNCTANNLAQFERNIWKCELGGFIGNSVCNTLNITPTLSNGDGSVAVNGNQVTISIQWQDSITRTDDATDIPTVTVVSLL